MSRFLKKVFFALLAATSVASFAQSQPAAAPSPAAAASGAQSSTISVADKHDALIAACRNIADWRVQAAAAVNSKAAEPFRVSIAEETFRLQQLNQICPGTVPAPTPTHKAAAKAPASSSVSTGSDVVKVLAAKLAEAEAALAKATATKALEACDAGLSRVFIIRPDGATEDKGCQGAVHFERIGPSAVSTSVAPPVRGAFTVTRGGSDTASASASASASSVAQVAVVPVSSTPKCGVKLNKDEIIQEWVKTPACENQIVAFSAQFKAECLADTRPNPSYATDLACGRKMNFLPK